MEKGSVIGLDYTGKTVLDGKVFESTIEKKAIDAGIFSEKAKYEPLTVVVGEGDVLPGLDEALKEMKVGEEKQARVLPKDGWGERKPQNIKVVPLQQFKREKMNPFPGLVVEVNGAQGRVQSVSGGRVRIDFNHPLAGKELLYDLKIAKEIKEPKEKVEALYAKYFYMVPEAEKKLAVGKDEVEVTLSPRWSANLGPLKKRFSELVTKYVKGFEKIRFVEEFREEKKAVKPEEGKEKPESPERETGKHEAENSAGKKKGNGKRQLKSMESEKPAEKPESGAKKGAKK